MPEFELATIDLIIIGVYIVAILFIGFWVGRGQKDSESYFLAGRGMAWWLVGFSLVITNFSGTQFLALAGAGYSTGIAVWNYEWMATIVLVFFALFVLPVYLQSKIQTVPEFLGRRYDQRSRKAFSGFTVITAMLIHQQRLPVLGENPDPGMVRGEGAQALCAEGQVSGLGG